MASGTGEEAGGRLTLGTSVGTAGGSDVRKEGSSAGRYDRKAMSGDGPSLLLIEWKALSLMVLVLLSVMGLTYSEPPEKEEEPYLVEVVEVVAPDKRELVVPETHSHPAWAVCLTF